MQQKVLDGRYELDRKIGEGGMARVYLGRDLRLNRRVAIKIPHRHMRDDADFLDRFRHEAQAAAILAHPNIVDVYDVGQDGDIHYIVMEYVEGTDLKSLINREAPLAVTTAVGIAAQIARGLSAAHRAGMVHRDIKPQNVIVTDDGHVRITDFGIAKSHLSTAMTETGVSLGTVDYISPEQAQGLQATPQSDIYALGIVLYEMLTARLPFKGDSAVAVAMKHVTEQPLTPRQINPHIPVQLEGLILRAMDKDPARRPRSAQEFAEQLANYSQLADQETVVNAVLGNEPAAARPPTYAPARPTSPIHTGNTGRVSIPPPRPTPARAPQQEGLGCGVFLVGMLILAGVLGIVMLFSSGALNDLFGRLSNGNGSPTPVVLQPSNTSLPDEPSPTPDARVSVPNLVGLSDGAAQELLRSLQLIPAPRSENHPSVSQGIVITQSVAAGELLEPNQPVSYTVSVGPVFVTVPNVRRMPQSSAQSQLTAEGLKVVIIEQPDREIDAGFVISQTPNPDLRIAQGETVTLRVSLGDVVRFPDVIGLQISEAQAILERTEGIRLEFIDEQGPDRLPNFENYAPNQVVSAQIRNGQGLNNGDYVPRDSVIILGIRKP
ncbi:Stk1 family PASTA domain-containing Ser/Thr kinase [Candidatus Oscillochloris fontis]|uniref:Stk1 family PASTA domain-containing Ser/Thr kinase n=1 Tax=Candidatus Oscillochloris fontis TaxID=2496868 RepID=UPI0015830C6A|nr:Stk1 family PASTA domain-containing Ser/Thr kinase [Candidatus Oscillochloris fontis]